MEPASSPLRPTNPNHIRVLLALPLNPTQTSQSDLQNFLSPERTLRQAAESRISQTNDEIEELSTRISTEANEMVAKERKERKKLEDMVREEREARRRLEEGWERGRCERLGVLKGRLGRIERVGGFLGTP